MESAMGRIRVVTPELEVLEVEKLEEIEPYTFLFFEDREVAEKYMDYVAREYKVKVLCLSDLEAERGGPDWNDVAEYWYRALKEHGLERFRYALCIIGDYG